MVSRSKSDINLKKECFHMQSLGWLISKWGSFFLAVKVRENSGKKQATSVSNVPFVVAPFGCLTQIQF